MTFTRFWLIAFSQVLLSATTETKYRLLKRPIFCFFILLIFSSITEGATTDGKNKKHTYFFNFTLADPQPALGNCQGDSSLTRR